MDIQKISDGLINDNSKIESVRQRTDSAKIGAFQKRVARKFTEQSKEPLAPLAAPLEVIEILGRAIAVELATGTPFLQNFQSVNIWKPSRY